jgi:K+-transporting ATPase c subunit
LNSQENTMQPYPPSVENPHELIGVRAAETDPHVIMEAAATRIARIRAASGSEIEIRRTLIASIIVARNDVLGRIAVGTPAGDRGSCTAVTVPE